MSDEMYSLDDARAELLRRECAAEGHDYEVIAVRTLGNAGHPIDVRCTRCGQHWPIPRTQEDSDRG
jgi:hypothetical protein